MKTSQRFRPQSGLKQVCICIALSLCFTKTQAQEKSMADSIHHIQEITVLGEKREKAEIARLDVPLLYLPMSVSTVSSKIWDERGITHIQDAVKFLPGAHMRTVYGAYQRLEVRGFDVTPIMIDGVKDERFVPPGNSAPFPDFASIETMELLKGPASVLHGQFAAGGILNVTRKAPSYTNVVNARLMYGSYSNKQAIIDFGGPIWQSLRYRAVFNMANNQGYRRTNDRRFSGYMALAYDINAKQDIEVRGGFNRDKYGTDSGLPPTMANDIYNASDATLYLSKSASLPGLDRRARYNNESDLFENNGVNVSVKYTNNFSEAFKLSEYLTYTYDMLDYFSTEPLSYLTSSEGIYNHYYTTTSNGVDSKTYICLDTIQLNSPLKFAHKSRMINNQLEGSGKFEFGNRMKYEYLAGYSFVGYFRDSYKGYNRAPKTDPFNSDYDVFGPGLYSKVSVQNPQSMGYMTARFSKAYPSEMYIHGLYLQNVVELSDQFKLMLAGRYDYVEYKKTDDNDVTDGKWKYDRTESYSTTKDAAFTYRAGLVYLPQETWSIYGSFANFFQPYRDFYSENTIYINADGNRYDPKDSKRAFKPQKGYQTEIGSKYSYKNIFHASIAAFYIKRTNEKKTLATAEEDGISKSVVGQVGTTKSKGVEVELGFNPIKELSFAFGYTYTHATVGDIKKNDYLNIENDKGVQLAYVPRTMIYQTGSYTLKNHKVKHLSFNYTLSFTDKMYNNLSKDVTLPSHFIVDCGVNYQLPNRVMIGANLNNVFNKHYATNTYGRQIIPCIGRNYTVSLSYSL